MKALVLWAAESSTNLGVRALAAGTEALIRSVWPDAEVSFQSSGPGAAPMRVGNPKRLLRERFTPGSELVTWMSGFDLVVDTRGGDSFADIYGIKRLLTSSLLDEIVVRAGVPLVYGPQTIGPFDSRRGQQIARWSVRRASLILTRDSVSAAYLRTLGNVHQVATTDVVFALDRPTVPRTRDVVLNVSGLLWNSSDHLDGSKYQSVVLDLFRSLVADGRRVTLLAHVLASNLTDNDVPAIEEAARIVGGDVELIVPESLDEVRATVASAELVIGSRMHACLNALSVGTSAIPLAYSRKFEPLLVDLGWRASVDLRTSPDPVRETMAWSRDDALSAQLAVVEQRSAAFLRDAGSALAAQLADGAVRR